MYARCFVLRAMSRVVAGAFAYWRTSTLVPTLHNSRDPSARLFGCERFAPSGAVSGVRMALTDVADAFFAVDSASAFFFDFDALCAPAGDTSAREAESVWAAARSGSFEPCLVAFFPLVVFAICLFRRAPDVPEYPDE